MAKRLLAFAATCLGFGVGASAEPVERDPVHARVASVVDRFVGQVRRCGVDPAFLPSITVESSGRLIGYDFDRRTMIVSRWSELPPPVQGMIGAWAEQGTMGLDAQGQFAEIFNDLLVAHELGHWLAHLSGGWRFGNDMWEAEVEANRITVAFLRLEADEASTTRRVANFNTFLQRLPSPVPPASSAPEHFNRDYQALSENPAAYGWYQGAFMRAAWSERANLDFCGLVRRNVAAAAPAG